MYVAKLKHLISKENALILGSFFFAYFLTGKENKFNPSPTSPFSELTYIICYGDKSWYCNIVNYSVYELNATSFHIDLLMPVILNFL